VCSFALLIVNIEMNKIFTIVLLLLSGFAYSQQLLTTFEKSNYQRTSTYQEGLAFYTELAKSNSKVKIIEKGLTDSGIPLHLVLIANDGDFDIASNRKKGKSVLLINNAIHAGEPDGVEASQMLARDILEDKKLSKLLDNTLLAIIPFYNIGGVLNRNTGSRTNQNGPEEKGFRGNARNFDLNRDFIKNDTRNAQSFSEIFHQLDPDLLIDTHVSNGADYQYVLTMVIPQSDKLGEPLKGYLDNSLMPSLFKQMATTPYEMSPYINVWRSTPDKGWSQFFDGPRYSSGYAALFQTIAFESETHMLKTFEQRTRATYDYIVQALIYLDKNGQEIIDVRNQAKNLVKSQKEFPIAWKLDKSDSTMIEHKGYVATYPTSEVSGLPRLKYDREQPYTKMVPYYNHFKATVTVTRPDYYVIPQQWHKVIATLKRNNVHMKTINSDSVIDVETYYISDYSARKRPYEGHYFHDKVEVEKQEMEVTFRAGDVLVPVNQVTNRYIIETLEPEATDSFFRWNFFDSILQMKEGFSSYVFEDEAINILNEDDDLKKEFEAKKIADKEFRENGRAQLQFIFMNSEHWDPSYMHYPIYRIILP
jgi:Zinc carboxypeptidase